MSSKPESPGAALVRHRWAKTTPEERSALAKKMVEARIVKLGQKRSVGPPRVRRKRNAKETT